MRSRPDPNVARARSLLGIAEADMRAMAALCPDFEARLAALAGARAHLYASFTRYAPRAIAGCPCCVDPDASRVLLVRPREELTDADLGHFAFKAMTTWGTPSDFKYFVPRILELQPTSGMGIVDLDLLADKLAYASFAEWPTTERDSILTYVRDLWSLMVLRYPWRLEAGALFTFVGRVGGSLDDFVDQLERAPDPPATEHLVDLVDWADGPKPAGAPARAAERIASRATATKLESAFFTCGDEQRAARISRALAELELRLA